MKNSISINELDKLYSESLKLLALYKKDDLTLPFSVKGNLGEFLFAKACLLKYPNLRIEYIGGAYPNIDIKINEARIQVKTQIKHPLWRFKNGTVDYEACPTIKKSVITDSKCDVIILYILHPNESYSQIKNSYFYSFTKKDFEMFTSHFCISGNKGDLSIYNILRITGTVPKGKQIGLMHYTSSAYKKLFKSSLNNWEKIETLFK